MIDDRLRVGVPTLCTAPAGYRPCHAHSPCPVTARWLTPSTHGGFAISGIEWNDTQGLRQSCLIPVEQGALLTRFCTRPLGEVPESVLNCLAAWLADGAEHG